MGAAPFGSCGKQTETGEDGERAESAALSLGRPDAAQSDDAVNVPTGSQDKQACSSHRTVNA
jgi:hypothetical protein